MLNENKSTPSIKLYTIYFSAAVSKLTLKPTTSKTMAWYIWYLMPVSKLFNCSSDNIFFKACAPKAPNITAKPPKILAKSRVNCVINNYIDVVFKSNAQLLTEAVMARFCFKKFQSVINLPEIRLL